MIPVRLHLKSMKKRWEVYRNCRRVMERVDGTVGESGGGFRPTGSEPDGSALSVFLTVGMAIT